MLLRESDPELLKTLLVDLANPSPPKPLTPARLESSWSTVHRPLLIPPHRQVVPELLQAQARLRLSASSQQTVGLIHLRRASTRQADVLGQVFETGVLAGPACPTVGRRQAGRDVSAPWPRNGTAWHYNGDLSAGDGRRRLGRVTGDKGNVWLSLRLRMGRMTSAA